MRYYGVRRNIKGEKEYRYIYKFSTLWDLQLNKDKKYLSGEALDGFISSFADDDTYEIKLLQTENDVKSFLLNPIYGVAGDNPTIEELGKFESVLSFKCMYTGKTNISTVISMLQYGVEQPSDMILKDARYMELINLGMLEEDFKLDWENTTYEELKKKLENGSYEQYKYMRFPAVSMETPLGEVQVFNFADPDCPSICVVLDTHIDDKIIDLVNIESPAEEYWNGDSEQIAIRVWGDPCNEDYTHKTTVYKHQIEEALLDWGSCN